MKVLFLFSIITIFCSCNNQGYSWIKIENNYFEKLESVKVGAISFNNLEPGHKTDKIKLDKGDYSIEILTNSQVRLSSILSLKSNDDLTLIITSEGKINISDI